MTTPLVLDAIEHAIWTRDREGITDLSGLIHHNDRGSQGDTGSDLSLGCDSARHPAVIDNDNDHNSLGVATTVGNEGQSTRGRITLKRGGIGHLARRSSQRQSASSTERA